MLLILTPISVVSIYSPLLCPSILILLLLLFLFLLILLLWFKPLVFHLFTFHYGNRLTTLETVGRIRLWSDLGVLVEEMNLKLGLSFEQSRTALNLLHQAVKEMSPARLVRVTFYADGSLLL